MLPQIILPILLFSLEGLKSIWLISILLFVASPELHLQQGLNEVSLQVRPVRENDVWQPYLFCWDAHFLYTVKVVRIPPHQVVSPEL